MQSISCRRSRQDLAVASTGGDELASHSAGPPPEQLWEWLPQAPLSLPQVLLATRCEMRSSPSTEP